MCEGVAYLIESHGKSVIMEEVISALLKDGKLVLVNEDGAERTVEGVKELRINMLKHEITVKI